MQRVMATRPHIDDIAYFIAFCVEIYKHAHKLSGAATCALFAKHRIMDFLADNYDVLHTQSPQWMLEEISSNISTC